MPSTLKSVPAILNKAHWIWPDNPHWDLRNAYALFRKSFSLKTQPKRAPLYITADQSYKLYINGHYICRGPARGFQNSWPYDEVDVAKWLKAGKNLIAVRAHNPGFSNFQYIHQGFAGLLIAAKWGTTSLLSDSSWKCRRQLGVRTDMVTTSLQLFAQEHIDLRLEDPDWASANHDDSTWTSQTVARPWNSLPWYELEARDIPMLSETLISPKKILGQSHGQSEANYQTTRNLALTRYSEGLSHKAITPDSLELHFKRTPKGQWRSQLIDFGKTQVGSIELEIKEASGGAIVETHHYETIDSKNLCPDYTPSAHSRMAFSQRIICRNGSNQHSFYHPFGFRYMLVTVRDNKTPLSIVCSLRTCLYPINLKGNFTSSENDLNKIWETCAWTQQVCSMDAYVDTPWREQAQWWGDARVQSWNTFHLSGDARLLKRGIRQIASQTTPDGVTYGHAPTVAHVCILPDFTLIWMLTLWDYYWQTGSLEPFIDHQQTILNALEYFEKSTDPKSGLLRYDNRFWLFLDWTNLRRQGASSVYSLLYLHTLDRLSEMYSLSGDSNQSALCQKKAQKLRKYLRKLIHPNGLMQDGYDECGRIDTNTSIHAQALAILTKLSPRNERVMLKQVLQPFLDGELKTDIQPSAYWITYIYSILAERGSAAEVVTDIRKRWAPMANYGTTWENFQPAKGDESFSHAWSAHPLFHLMQIIGGIRQVEAGWQKITVNPVFIGESAQITVPTPLGQIRSYWKRNGNSIEGNVKIPSKIEALLKLPGQKAITITDQQNYTCIAE